MKVKLFKYLLSTSVLLSGFLANAQVDPCLTNLKDAATKTEQGWYDDAISLLENTLADCNLSSTDKIQANKLLITNYLATDNLEGAEAAAAAIMKISPNYEADKLKDPVEVVLLFEKYKPEPQFRVFVSGGVNFSIVNASNTYSVVSDNDSPDLDNYESEMAFQIALGAEYRMYKQLWLIAAFQFRKSNYDIEIPNIQGRSVYYEEDISYLEIPLSAKYYFLKSRIQPFIQLGANFSYLNTALGELTRDEDVNDIINREPQRNNFYVGVIGGIGLSYYTKGFGFQMGVNYLYNPQQVNKDGTRYDNLNTIFKYYYVDNDFTMNDVQLNVGISYVLGYKKALTPSN